MTDAMCLEIVVWSLHGYHHVSILGVKDKRECFRPAPHLVKHGRGAGCGGSITFLVNAICAVFKAMMHSLSSLLPKSWSTALSRVTLRDSIMLLTVLFPFCRGSPGLILRIATAIEQTLFRIESVVFAVALLVCCCETSISLSVLARLRAAFRGASSKFLSFQLPSLSRECVQCGGRFSAASTPWAQSRFFWLFIEIGVDHAQQILSAVLHDEDTFMYVQPHELHFRRLGSVRVLAMLTARSDVNLVTWILE